jgi:hypothetical protein
LAHGLSTLAHFAHRIGVLRTVRNALVRGACWTQTRRDA